MGGCKAKICGAGLLVCVALAQPASALDIVFDYSYDTLGFFDSHPQAKASLERAADHFRAFTDSLDAIVPGTVYNAGTSNEFVDTWRAYFRRPDNGNLDFITDLEVPANTLIVYAGGHDIEDGLLYSGGLGLFTSNGVLAHDGQPSWEDRIYGRGNPAAIGQQATDFSPWGGSVMFDTVDDLGNPIVWHDDANSSPSWNEYDFYSNAIRAIGHMMGFGLAPSWKNNLDGDTFRGLHAMAQTDGPTPLDDGLVHWEQSLVSATLGFSSQGALMKRLVNPGQREELTRLDYAGFADMGWEFDAPGLSKAGDFNGNGELDAHDIDLLRVIPELGDGWIDVAQWLRLAKTLEGDANLDGTVDAFDFAALAAGFNESGSWAYGNFNLDSVVDAFDFALLADNFNQSYASLSSDPATTPEPASAALLVAFGLATTHRRQTQWRGECAHPFEGFVRRQPATSK